MNNKELTISWAKKKKKRKKKKKKEMSYFHLVWINYAIKLKKSR